MENGIMNITQENKELLFKNLSARLPYHVRVKVWLKDGTTEEGVLDLEHNYADVLRDAFYYNKIVDIKPYLRPLSSMTEEEMDAYANTNSFLYTNGIPYNLVYTTKGLFFLLNNHFDIFDLISKGLAIAVTEENNPYK